MTNIFSDIPIWAIAVWAVLAFLISWYYYKKRSWLKEVKSSMRRLMFLLRGLGLTLLGVLLANLLIRSTKTELNNPLLITVVDNSSSMLNYKDSSKVEDEIKNFQRKLNASFGSRFDNLIYTLDGSVQSIDSLGFSSGVSDFSSSLNSIYNDYYGRNIGAVIFLSDGNYNKGARPTFTAEKFKNVPFYTVGVGDTVQKTDQRIQNIVANDIAFLDNAFPIEVVVEGIKLSERKYKITLFEDGKKLHEKEYEHNQGDVSLTKVKFLVDAKSSGVHEYMVRLSEMDDEYNVKNNTKRIYLEVIDDRSKVLMIAEGMHPDLGAIKMALASEQNLETEIVTTRNIDEAGDLEDYDLIIWHNPGTDRKESLFNKISRTELPIWYITGPATSQQTLQRLKLVPTVQTTGQKDNVAIAFNTRFNLFELSESTIRSINEFPPMTAHYGKISYPKNNSILGFQKVGNIAKPEPIFFFGERKEKYAVTYGNGLWNWRLGNYQQNQSHEAFNELIQKTVQYLIIKENRSRLRISVPKEINTVENTVIDARFYNESYEPITEPTINFKLEKADGTSFEYAFLALDDHYQLDLGKLDFGRYSWKADVTFNGETFEKTGSFAVEEVALEAQSTRADHQLLNQIAMNQSGKFYELDKATNVIADLEQRKDITPLAYEQSTFEKLIDNLWWFVLLIVLFGGEWFLRRYNGGY
tara:strand:+ start:41889 stop:43976 length:2088 start_codon:yes stop_codon:yes gene_type:complete